MNISIEIDPNGKFLTVEMSRVIGAAGLLPYFALEAFELLPEGGTEEVYQMLVSIYGMGDYRMPKGGTVSPEGVYNAPEDPPLDPIVSVSGLNTTVYIYQYAIIAVVDKNDTIVSRMD